MGNAKKTAIKKPKNNIRIGMLVSSNNPKSDEPADFGVVIKKYKRGTVIRYDILWQKDKEISIGYSADDIKIYREFYKMWEEQCQNSN